ncbi:putative flippase GtrA [Agromyces flavus]|uniref:Flippase GtrA n=1 Tax=Agromyces flavus TaxID=589382 RepID=A0A1H1V656_9MICO|nr:GtrA family protein [Agromyces flavus]MCP2365863.1 putative flippase GtrA [Agromyces flavus]SDS80183.1 Putative flippase GtrA (transmembrane translocase of bactoprenol-linked glucose) [Agromyces flavus]
MSQHARWRRIAGLGARFLTVGAVSTLIEIVVFNLLYLVLGVDLVASKIIASLVALVNAYLGNREWTFRDRGGHSRAMEITLFVIVNAACTALGALIVWVGVLGASALLGREAGPFAVNLVNLASIVVVVMLRFLLYHYVVFRGVRKPKAAQPEPTRTP